MSAFMRSAIKAPALAFLALLTSANAVFIEYENCLSSGIINSQPLLLQWAPLYFQAQFDTSNTDHNLQFTLYGNVTGKQYNSSYPPPNDPSWLDPNSAFGKITNLTDNRAGITAQETKVTFLDYNAWTPPTSIFCDNDFQNGGCPLGPLFNASATNSSNLHAFTVQQNLNSSFAFTTLTATVTIKSGDTPPVALGCISANITPDLGSRLRSLLTWLPAAILILKAISTVAAAIWSPWGSTDIFRWSSNYGRDEDLLRLVTPGFGDCLQYIQFIMLTGSLSLQYPGYFQPAVANTAWSCLLFNESFVSHGPGTRSLIDGIYATNGTYGMGKMSQLVGMTQVTDIWACMAVWLAVIAIIVIVLCQVGFLSRFIYRQMTNTTEEDLRAKNLPFTTGNLIRLLFNYFILPIVALSFFQLVLAGQSPVSVVVMSAVLLVIMIVSAAWILRFIFKTKPRTFLFDDMPTVLLYGPFYNTYSDSAAPFALLPVLITFMRGVAIGAVQPSGIAQIVILAICEVILILTLNGLRPFQGLTSMNLQHTVYSAVRLATILLQIAFVPRLGVTEGPKGWVGYVILILHACVLVFGFLLNSAQTLFEVIARACGVGGHGAVRGSILTFRMLKKRQNRPSTGDRQSLMSTAAMLRHTDEFDPVRSRSLSASSQQLLNQTGGRTPSTHRLSGFENFSSAGDVMSPLADTESTAYFGAHGQAPSKKSTDITNATENFYRPPRQRRGTGDLITPGSKSRQSQGSVDFPYSDSPGQKSRGVSYGSYKRDTPAAAYLRERADSDAEAGPRTDYAVREVDQYYRGQPLASGGTTRKLKTGPADPQSPASNAQSWFQRVFGGTSKEKDKGKGFEVVRSTRAPPELQQGEPREDYEMVNSPPMQEPYTDSPREEEQAVSGAQRDSANSQVKEGFDFGLPTVGSTREVVPDLISTHPALRPSTDSHRDQHPGMRAEMPRSGVVTSDKQPQHISGAPTLSPIESVGGFDLPSRFNSRASTTGEPGRDWLTAIDKLDWPDHTRDGVEPAPRIPQRSSRRESSAAGSRPLSGINFGPIEEDVVSPQEAQGHGDFERPTSLAVSKHRAADSITRNSLGAGQIASTAELFHTDEK